jgi:hypothetical protein
MSRSTIRRAVAYPRGRPHAKTLPFVLPASRSLPKPILEYHQYYIVDGVPVHFVGQRWKAEDAAHSPTPGAPDPYQPGIVLSSRLEDASGAVIQAVSYDQWRAATRALRAGSTARTVAIGRS